MRGLLPTTTRQTCCAYRCHMRRWHASAPLNDRQLAFVRQRLTDARREGLLKDPNVKEVWLRDMSACHVVYGSCHVLQDDVLKVQKLLKYLNPDKICVELCADRSCREEVFEDDRVFDARVENMQKRTYAEGLEMVAALRAARRHGVPGMPIDRKESITEARLQAACPGNAAPLVWCPKVAWCWALLRLLWQVLKHHTIRRTRHGSHTLVVPVGAIRDIPLPWKWRRELVERSLVEIAEWHEGQQEVSVELLMQMLKLWDTFQEQSLSKPASEIRKELLLKPAFEPLSCEGAQMYGPESVHDIIERIFVHERDIHMAYIMRTQSQQPLTLTIVGVEHLNGVVQHLGQEQVVDMKIPRVQLWKTLLYPKGKLSKTYQFLHQRPQLHFRAVSNFTLGYALRTLVELSAHLILATCWRGARIVFLSKQFMIFGVVAGGVYWVCGGFDKQSDSGRGRAGSSPDAMSVYYCIKNTCIHAWQQKEPLREFHRCLSAPASLNYAEIIMQAQERKNKLSKGSEGHDGGQCKGFCRHEKISVGHCSRGQDCPDCHVPGCEKKRHKFGNKGKQQRARESGQHTLQE